MNVLEIGLRIKRQREQHRLTQQQLANSLHISYQAISKWERGENAPDISLLPALASIFGVSIDWLLIGQERPSTSFEASILCTSIRHFAHKSHQLPAHDIATYLNAQFSYITDCVLAQDGVPVKYIGDGFLAYFSKSSHAERALIAAHSMVSLCDHPDLLITLHCGSIYLGAIGHKDYSQLDIIGSTVNTCFLMNHWANTHTKTDQIIMSESFKQASSTDTLITYDDITLQPNDEVIRLFSVNSEPKGTI